MVSSANAKCELFSNVTDPSVSLPQDALSIAADIDGPINVLYWDGYVRASVLMEPPAHFRATETLVEPLWDSGFNLLTEEQPSIVEIRFNWTSATPTEMMMMAHAPDSEEDHRSWVEYEYPVNHVLTLKWPTEGPLCMRIATEDLATGHWHIMAHSKPTDDGYGTDIKFNFTITTVGGKTSIPTGLHGHEVDPKEVTELAELYTEQAEGKQRKWKACRLSGDDVYP